MLEAISNVLTLQMVAAVTPWGVPFLLECIVGRTIIFVSIYTFEVVSYIYIFNSMFYQLLRVQHSCSSTQSWGSVLPSIVETRDQNSRGCPLLFSNRNLGSFCA